MFPDRELGKIRLKVLGMIHTNTMMEKVDCCIGCSCALSVLPGCVSATARGQGKQHGRQQQAGYGYGATEQKHLPREREIKQ